MSQSGSAKYLFRSSVGCDSGKVLLHAAGLPLPTTRRLNASATSGTSSLRVDAHASDSAITFRSPPPPLQYARRQAEIAIENRLKVVEGKIPLPDLRIEYQTVEGELARIDLELATEHYHGGHAAGKLKAGFKVYADRHSASRLNAALSYGRGSTYDGPELTAKILSL
jgi:hypothetical protein